jgi:endonuclease G
MGAVETQIAKAESRFSADIAAKAAAPTRTAPIDLVGPDVVRKRHDFLCATLPDPAEATETLERILNGNELQPISYLERGAIAAKAVARIAIRSAAGSGWGTGFLIAPGVLLTNNHVLPSSSVARGSLAQFAFELSLADQPLQPISFEFDPDSLFTTSVDLDFTAVAVRSQAVSGDATLAPFGWLPLVEMEGKVFEGEWLTVIQHPRGERKQVCVRENRLIKRDDPVLWYTSDTQAGSSGSPVFNNDWYVVALHHSGVPEYRDGRIQTIDGRDFDSTRMDETHVKWIANEGIRASRITKALRAALPTHPLLQPLFSATPQSARILAPPAKAAMVSLPIQPPEIKPMTQAERFPMILRVRINADGSATIMPGDTGREAQFEDAPARAKSRPVKYDVPFDATYANRNGYQPDFLGDAMPVGMPVLDADLSANAAPLLKPTPKNKHVLDYANYSVIMHAKRRLAIFSAANVDFDHRLKDLSRPPDVWRRDPRIAREHQIENWYYAANNFDRGHLTRNEDMEYGKTRIDALAAAADTCHWTNCTPQHGLFNQNKTIWQGIERYILEETIFDIRREVKAQVFTGPVLDEGDPEYKDIQYPVRFWKVVVALDDARKLIATAYIASQADVIAKHGIEASPFGAFLNFQTSVAEIERLTGLTFIGKPGQHLRDLDPFVKRLRRRSRPGTLTESLTNFEGAGGPYHRLTDLDDIVV